MSDEISEKELADLKIDENEDESTNYKAPAKKTIDELNQLDAEDESLRKYKEVFDFNQAFFRRYLILCSSIQTFFSRHYSELVPMRLAMGLV